MTIQELRAQPHLSASSVREYLECGLHYRFSHIDAVPKEFIPDALVFGSAMHRTIDRYHRERCEGTFVSQEDTKLMFARYWKEAVEATSDIKYRDGSDFASLRDKGMAMIGVYVDQMKESPYRMLATEQPFKLVLDGLLVPVIGVIDLIEEDDSGTIIITENKTAARSYSADDVDGNLQLTLYHLAARSGGFKDRAIILKIDCLLKTKTPRFEQYYTTRSPEDERRIIRLVSDVWHGIASNVFLPNLTSWKCQNCEYKSHCDSYLTAQERSAA